MADAKGRGSHVVTEHSYDAQGRRTKTLAPDPSAGASGAGTVATRFVYDGAGRLCRVVENSTQSDATFGGLADPCSTAIAGTATTNVSTHYGYDEA
ncbi:MAG TPA: hypothetical protein VM344_02970, partial [Vitreimonas sp.]|nr:hypothetical protein [Vitreimonas sp.]